MKRRNRDQGPAVNPQASGIPPWINQFGQPVWNNPWGQYRPNTQGLAAAPVAPVQPTMAPAQPLPEPVARYLAPPPLEFPAPAVELVAPTHQVTDDGRIEADEERIRSTIQYAKGYAKACKSLGIEIPEDMRGRLKSDTAQRRSQVHKRVRRTVAAATAVGAGAFGMTAAAAYWTSHGSGSGAASTTTVSVTVAASAGTPSTPLYPGGTGDVTLKVNNPNSVPVTLKKVQGNGAITADAGHPSCSITGVTFTDQTSLSQSLPANTNNNAVDLAGAASMSVASDTGCQGATFTIPVKVTVQQP